MPYWVQLSILVVLVAGAVTAALLLPDHRAEIVGGVLLPVFVGLATVVGRLFGRREGALSERRKITEEYGFVKRREPTERVLPLVDDDDTKRDDEVGKTDVIVLAIFIGVIIAAVAIFSCGLLAGQKGVHPW